MKINLVILILSTVVFSSCNTSQKQMDYKSQALELLYESDKSSTDKIESLNAINRETITDSICYAICITLLEGTENRVSTETTQLLENTKLFEYAMTDSLEVYNFTFLGLKKTHINFPENLPYITESILNQKDYFMQKRIDTTPIIIPINIPN